MLETGNTRIDIQQLQRQVAWDARKFGYLWSGARLPDPLGDEPIEDNPETLVEHIDVAAGLSNIEAPAYSMQRYPAPLRWAARAAARAVLYLSSIITHAQTRFNYQIVSALHKVDRHAARMEETRHKHEGILAWASETLQSSVDRLTGVEQAQGEILRRLSEGDSARTGQAAELAALRDRQAGLEQQRVQQLETQNRELTAALEAQQEQLAHLAGRLSLQERLLNQAGRDTATAVPEIDAAAPEAALTRQAEGALDGLYMVFEDHFRGSREEILQRLCEYLPLVRNCLSGDVSGMLVDLGCGRGEWLELLANEGIAARGVDNNPGFLVQCEELDLEVMEDDALEHLAGLPDASLAVVTGFHIIEHLPFDFLVRLIDEVHRVLRKDGLVLFETPNPKNLIVGACNFYADPTHVRQVFPDLLEFVMQSRGFRNVELRYLHPHPEEQQLCAEEAPVLAGQLNGLLSCARDFAVVAYK